MRIGYTIILSILGFLLVSSTVAFLSTIFPSGIHSSQTPADYGYEYEDITLQTKDKVNLAGWLVKPKESAAPNTKEKLIIIMHGYPADKGNVLHSTIHLAEEYPLLYFDFRALGESGGRYSTLGIHEQKDLATAINYAKEEGYERIGLWGFSVGGAVGLMQAPKYESVQSTVAVSAYAQMGPLAEQLFRVPLLDSVLAELVRGYAYLLTGSDINDISPKDALSNYQKPVFIIHPRGDKTIPLSDAKELQHALQENPNAQFWFPSGSHGTFPQEEHNKKIESFFYKNL